MIQHLIHLKTQIVEFALPPVKSVHAFIVGKKLQMHFQTDIGNASE